MTRNFFVQSIPGQTRNSRVVTICENDKMMDTWEGSRRVISGFLSNSGLQIEYEYLN